MSKSVYCIDLCLRIGYCVDKCPLSRYSVDVRTVNESANVEYPVPTRACEKDVQSSSHPTLQLLSNIHFIWIYYDQTNTHRDTSHRFLVLLITQKW